MEPFLIRPSSRITLLNHYNRFHETSIFYLYVLQFSRYYNELFYPALNLSPTKTVSLPSVRAQESEPR